MEGGDAIALNERCAECPRVQLEQFVARKRGEAQAGAHRLSEMFLSKHIDELNAVYEVTQECGGYEGGECLMGNQIDEKISLVRLEYRANFEIYGKEEEQ